MQRPDRMVAMSCRWAHGLEACATFFLLLTPLLAHHSTAAFDMTRAHTVSGAVTRFIWANPHSYIEIEVNGQPWRLEIEAVNLLRRYGWTKDSLKSGDVVDEHRKLTTWRNLDGAHRPGVVVRSAATIR